MKLRVDIKDKFGSIHKLSYELYNTNLTKKWIEITIANLKNPNHNVVGVFNNRTQHDIPDLKISITDLINTINEEYDRQIKVFDEYNKEALNYLHQEFELFGERGLKVSKSLSDNFFTLNEYIHMFEDALDARPGHWAAFGILYDIHPLGLHYPILEEDKLMLDTEFSWGKLYLGYNTLGKDWLSVFKDNDIDVISRGMVKSQERFSAETWLNFGGEHKKEFVVRKFGEWYDNLSKGLQQQVPLDNLNQLSLGRFLLGELIIDDNFLKYDPDPYHWKAYRHPCKLEWNHRVLTTFRSIEAIKFL